MSKMKQPIKRAQVIDAVKALGLDPELIHSVSIDGDTVKAVYFELKDGRKFYRESLSARTENGYAKTAAYFDIHP